MDRIFRVGMVGGGAESFMGGIHREAIQRCGRAKLVCGAFGATRNSSYESGKALKLPTNRVYGTYRDMFRKEQTLPEDERMDFVVIATTNTMHYPVSMSALDAHFPIFCEKPFTCNLDEALNLERKRITNDVSYGIAMAYAGYPAVRRARELVLKEKAIGTLRKVVMSYDMGWLAPRLETAGNRQAGWRTDPRRCGPAGCLMDLGVHCFYMAEWLTGMRVASVCGDLRPTVPGRILDDDCTVLARFENGIRGVFTASQIDTGAASGLSFRMIGDQASVGWSQDHANLLRILRPDGKEEIEKQAPRCLSTRRGSQPCPPTPYGDNEPYLRALTDTYQAFLDYLEGDKARRAAAEDRFMTVSDGIRSVAFVEAVVKNTAEPAPSDDDSQPPPPRPKWEPIIVPEVSLL